MSGRGGGSHARVTRQPQAPDERRGRGSAFEREEEGHIFQGPSLKTKALKSIPAGTILYPRDNKSGT
jgi:hypothetical protein